MECIFSLNIRG